MKDYHKTLMIPKGANKDTIKKAYRKLALKYHPDRNRSVGVKEKFLEISFAYEMLTSPTFNSQQRETAEFNQAQHQARKQYEARRQAEAHARMKRKEFMNSESYKIDQAELALLDQLHLIAAFFMVFIMPLLSYLLWDLTGLFSACGLLFVSWAFWIDLFISDKKLNLNQLFSSFKTVSTSAGFRIGSLILFNLYAFFITFLNTVLNHTVWLKIIGSWLVTFFIVFIVFNIIKTPIKKVAYAFLLPMTIFMFALILNRTFSRNHHIEEYNFKRGSQVVKGRSQSTTFIYLPNNEYKSEIGLRIFPDEGSMKSKNYISYEFAAGLFGIKVLKGYSFLSKHKKTTPYYLN